MLEAVIVCCPYCGESFETTVDCSAGSQRYVEDCYVCCQPILFTVRVDWQGELIAVETSCENP